MAYNTTAIKTDVNGKPIPQYFDPLADEYKPLLGQYGAALSILYGPDGQPIGTSGNPLQVRAQDTDDALEQIKTALEALATEDKLEVVRLLLQTLDGKDFATQTTLVQVKQALDTLTGAVSTSSKQDALNIAVEDLKSELNLVKSELATIKANQLSGDQKVQLSGNIVELIREYVESDALLSYQGYEQAFGHNTAWWATRFDFRPLDVSQYRDLVIYVNNRHDTALKARIWTYTIATVNFSSAITPILGSSEEVTIPALSSMTFLSRNHPILSDPSIGIGINLKAASSITDGHVTVRFLGRR